MSLNLEILCKGINNASVRCSDLELELEEVSADFIEQIPAKDIVLYKDNRELLKAMDYEDIAHYLEVNFDVKIRDMSKDVL
jgi:site-specific recombinase XerC